MARAPLAHELVWDNVRMHLTKPLREFIAANADWLTVFQLPTYIGNLVAVDLSRITRAVKRKLKMIQYRPT
ncbi:hypothetical protein ACFWDI_09465 [Streptomyces sp. NPDC060064]|uniref:hypothetical protein n=1 Tax=Streptomyces sp. NPDC060064 TaxID=3347049 RepID=UPI0036A13A2A